MNSLTSRPTLRNGLQPVATQVIDTLSPQKTHLSLARPDPHLQLAAEVRRLQRFVSLLTETLFESGKLTEAELQKVLDSVT